MFEANALGQIRTGAASGFATDLLAKPDARELAVITRKCAPYFGWVE
jgi:ornithine cyclodeaminase/alanine dehydrogenase-like protein (mu-crystallin family)